MNDFECETRYHPGKAKIVVVALGSKEQAKPHRVMALTLTIRSNCPYQIWKAQLRALGEENKVDEWLWGMEK